MEKMIIVTFSEIKTIYEQDFNTDFMLIYANDHQMGI